MEIGNFVCSSGMSKVLYRSCWRVAVRHFDIQKALGVQKHWQASSVSMLNWRGKTRKLSKDLAYKLQNILIKLVLYEMKEFTHPDLIFVLFKLCSSEPLGSWNRLAGQGTCLVWEVQSRSLLPLWLAVTPLQTSCWVLCPKIQTLPLSDWVRIWVSTLEFFSQFQQVKLSRKHKVWREHQHLGT